jgi:hypothetical protein
LLVDELYELRDVVWGEDRRQVLQVAAERGRSADLVLVDPVRRFS